MPQRPGSHRSQGAIHYELIYLTLTMDRVCKARENAIRALKTLCYGSSLHISARLIWIRKK